MAQVTTREQALDLCRTLPNGALEAVALIVETADSQGEWTGGGYTLDENGDRIDPDEDGGSMWEDDVQGTLNALAAEFRGLKRG